MEAALRESIRRNPREIATAIFPVLGPAIRKAIGLSKDTPGEMAMDFDEGRQVAAGTVRMLPYTEMLDLVIVNGQAKGIITRNLRSGKMERHPADAVVLADDKGEEEGAQDKVPAASEVVPETVKLPVLDQPPASAAPRGTITHSGMCMPLGK